jgi:hypothetical protein
MSSMPQSLVLSQASSDPNEVVVGVDIHKDVHGQRCSLRWACCEKPRRSPLPQPATKHCWRG